MKNFTQLVIEIQKLSVASINSKSIALLVIELKKYKNITKDDLRRAEQALLSQSISKKLIEKIKHDFCNLSKMLPDSVKPKLEVVQSKEINQPTKVTQPIPSQHRPKSPFKKVKESNTKFLDKKLVPVKKVIAISINHRQELERQRNEDVKKKVTSKSLSLDGYKNTKYPSQMIRQLSFGYCYELYKSRKPACSWSDREQISVKAYVREASAVGFDIAPHEKEIWENYLSKEYATFIQLEAISLTQPSHNVSSDVIINVSTTQVESIKHPNKQKNPSVTYKHYDCFDYEYSLYIK